MSSLNQHLDMEQRMNRNEEDVEQMANRAFVNQRTLDELRVRLEQLEKLAGL